MFRCCVADLGQLKTRNTAVASSSRLDLIPKSMNEVLRRELWCCDLTPGEVVTSDIPTKREIDPPLSLHKDAHSNTFWNLSSEKFSRGWEVRRGSDLVIKLVVV
jgi:hypothetical protein